VLLSIPWQLFLPYKAIYSIKRKQYVLGREDTLHNYAARRCWYAAMQLRVAYQQHSAQLQLKLSSDTFVCKTGILFLSQTLNQMPDIITEFPQFFTSTNLEWKKLLSQDKYKDMVVESLRFLVVYKRIKLYAFVIMSNHIHLIWQMRSGIKPDVVQRDFLKYTAQRIKYDLERNHPEILKNFLVNAKDRKYQFWERNALSVELRTAKVFQQKLDYIHLNPVKAGICKLPEQYKYSTAKFYETGIDDWGFVTHYKD
jgi:putative transposase